MSDAQPPAGWYPDPSTGEQRYWNGVQWTVHQPAGVTMTAPAPASPGGRRGLAIAALVLGLLALLSSFVPGLSFVTWAPAIAGIVLGIIALASNRAGKGMATTGIVTAAVGLIIAIIVSIAFIAAVGATAEQTGNAPGTAAAEKTESNTTEVPAESAKPAPETPAEDELSEFVELNSREYALLVKDPDGHVGESIIIYGVVTQFDAATGTCSFRANTSNTQQTNSFDYSTNTMLIAGDGTSDCPVVSDIVQEDHVKLWVTSLGSYTYDTQIGGSTVVPLFEILKLDLLPATEY